MSAWRNRLPVFMIRPWLLLLASALLIIQLLLTFPLEEMTTMAFYYDVGLHHTTFLKGQVWNLITYSLFHHPQAWSHLLCNLFLLIYLAGRISHILGDRPCVKILILGILVSGIFHLILDPFIRVEPAPLIGISGGVCALFSCLCMLAPDSKFFPLMISGRNLLKASLITTLIIILISPKLNLPYLSDLGELLNSSILFSLFAIGHVCHLGGMLLGMLYAHMALRIPSAR